VLSILFYKINGGILNMDFRPQSGEKITIDQPFVFMPHPAAPDFPYGQSGRRGTVYQVCLEKSIGNGEEYSYQALKVFSEFFQDPRNAETALRLISCAGMPGLEACYRKVIIPGRYPNLIQKYHQLAFAVLMPWVNGETWFDIISSRQVLSNDQSYGLAKELMRCLVEMERRKMAHCDLSGANVLVQPDRLKVSFVDVEEMYIPGLSSPEAKKLPAGTPGYGHKTASGGLWSPEADRFAGAILIGEILGWCSEKVCQNACEGQYFDIDEVQTSCNRFRILQQELRRQWGIGISDLFAQAWFSPSLTSCPSFEKWQSVLDSVASPEASAPSLWTEVPTGESALNDLQPVNKDLAQVYQPVDLGISVDSSTAVSPRTMEKRRAQKRPRKIFPGLFLRQRVLIFLFLGVILLGGGVGGSAWLLTPRGESLLQGRVLDVQSGQPLPARIELKGPGSRVVQTANANGEYQFAHLPGMAAEITASLKGYLPTTTTINIPDADTVQLPVYMKLSGSKIYGKVINSTSGTGLPGAKITLSGTYLKSGKAFTQTYTTGTTGAFDFILDDGGTAELTIEKSAYEVYHLPAFTISAGQQIPVPDITLVQLQ
jgi:hypothetical protein